MTLAQPQEVHRDQIGISSARQRLPQPTQELCEVKTGRGVRAFLRMRGGGTQFVRPTGLASPA